MACLLAKNGLVRGTGRTFGQKSEAVAQVKTCLISAEKTSVRSRKTAFQQQSNFVKVRKIVLHLTSDGRLLKTTPQKND